MWRLDIWGVSESWFSKTWISNRQISNTWISTVEKTTCGQTDEFQKHDSYIILERTMRGNKSIWKTHRFAHSKRPNVTHYNWWCVLYHITYMCVIRYLNTNKTWNPPHRKTFSNVSDHIPVTLKIVFSRGGFYVLFVSRYFRYT